MTLVSKDLTLYPAGGDSSHRLIIIFANILDPDQAQHVGPDLDPNWLTPRW